MGVIAALLSIRTGFIFLLLLLVVGCGITALLCVRFSPTCAGDPVLPPTYIPCPHTWTHLTHAQGALRAAAAGSQGHRQPARPGWPGRPTHTTEQ